MRLDLASLAQAYRSKTQTVHDTVEFVLQQIDRSASNPIWISRVSADALHARADELASGDPALPLYGVPFAIKDNIDLAGLPTTAACPAFAKHPAQSAAVVQKLLDAGAIAIGKTNLDQFATGLVGTRSPYGVCHNSFDARYISGGSSSGSAVAVALGQVSFALGTDTAGSGRVPAAFNNLIGYKPTLGRLSTRGMLPACRTLDAISIFALTASDAVRVAHSAAGFDPGDPWSRNARLADRRGWSYQDAFRFGVPLPSQRDLFGNIAYAQLLEASISRCAALGGIAVEVDIEPLLQVARLLYEGPWVAERYLAVQHLLENDPEALHPVTRRIIEPGRDASALDAFRAQYRLQEQAAIARRIWEQVDVLLLPTAGSHYTIAEVLAEPLLLNSNLGRYTNFVNLLDLAAVAVPAGFTQQGLPFGVTLIAPAWQDDELLRLAGRLHAAGVHTLGATGMAWPAAAEAPPPTAATIDIAVCGAHMSGLPLNRQLTERGAWRIAVTSTTPEYRLYALPGGPPARPGLVRVPQGGVAIEMEIWRMPDEHFASFMRGIPAPLGIGQVRNATGAGTCGFLCESAATAGATDISRHGGWRNYLLAGSSAAL
ncbi:MAG: allophanate hydrolase [Steroidobacteraceae bacterium]